MASGTFYPAVSADDGWLEIPNYFDNSYTYTVISSIDLIFIRFPNVTIPAGATITSAVIKLYASVSRSGFVSMPCAFEDADNPSAVASYADGVSRTKTTADATWSSGAWVINTQYDSPNLKDSLQEVIDRVGWASGNAVQWLTSGAASGDGYAYTYEGAGYKPVLFVEWTDLAPVIADGIGISDVAVYDNVVYQREISDALSAVDTVGQRLIFVSAILDNVSFITECTWQILLVKAANDSIKVTDVSSYDILYGSLLREVLRIWDYPYPGWVSTIADVLNLIDAALLKYGISISEWLTLQDAAPGNWIGTERITELITITDLQEAVKTIALSIAETVTLEDLVTKILSIQVLEYLAYTEAFSIFESFAVLEALSLSDETIRSFDKVIADVLANTDAALSIWLLNVGIADSVAATDSLGNFLTLSQLATEAITVTDIATSQGNLFSLILESLQLGLTLNLDGEIWQCWVITNTTFDLSVYSGFDFNSYCNFQKKSYGVKANGFYALEGTTDAGPPIHAGVVLGATNFGTENRKKIRRASLGLSGTNAAIRVQTDEGSDRIFLVTDRRAYIDRDIVGKDYVLSISEFNSLDFIDLVPIVLAR